MAKTSSFITLSVIQLDPDSPISLYQQLYENLRQAILMGRLAGGTRLPSTRALAVQLKISRNTVINGFEKLMAEGYLEGKIGAGTYITHALPEEILQVKSTLPPINKTITHHSPLSQQGDNLVAAAASRRYLSELHPFRPCLPAFEAFPFKLWEKVMARRWRQLTANTLNYGQAAGYQPLREAIAHYVGLARGVQCEAAQVMVVAGAQQAIDLAARVLIDPHDSVWIEDPAYLGARHALLGAGARLRPIPVDHEGLDVEAGKRLEPTARLVYITPSYQYPTGAVMSLARRLKLLQWASQAGAWILEDDYDGEYRYTGHPLAALQGLDQAGRVVYIGTFSKVLFPALRLGYMIVPTNLIEAFAAALALSNRGLPTFEQAVVTDFMTEGHFARHIRRMRTLYAERQAVLVEAVQRELAGCITVQAAEAGMHLVGWLPPQAVDHEVSWQLGQAGIDAPPLSAYALQYSPPSGLALGYTSFTPEAIRAGVTKMARCLVK